MTAPNLEQIIADHERVRMMRLATCRCGWEEPIYDRDATALHAAHVVAAIRDSGYTVIALPEAEKQAEFIEDIATHGIGADLNPTRRWDGDQTSEYLWWSEYIGGAVGRLRRRASALLAERNTQ